MFGLNILQVLRVLPIPEVVLLSVSATEDPIA